MAKVQNYTDTRHILATDLDGTLVGHDGYLREFNSCMSRKRNDFLLVYITGRIFSSAWEMIRDERLLLPHVLITDVGTEIRFAPHFKPDKNWEMKMKLEWDTAKIKGFMEKYSKFKPQGVSPRYRLAYQLASEEYKDAITQLNQEIDKAEISIKAVPSLGYLVDIIPLGAGKGSALEYLRQMLGFSREHTVVCGDSGNDLSMFYMGYKGIVVGNAHSELKLQLKKNEVMDVYFAKKQYAAGILEGLINMGIIGNSN